MTNTTAPALTIAQTNEEIRARHAAQSDLHRLTDKTRKQYDAGMLTLEEFMLEIIAIRNAYSDDPESGIWVLDCIRD